MLLEHPCKFFLRNNGPHSFSLLSYLFLLKSNFIRHIYEHNDEVVFSVDLDLALFEDNCAGCLLVALKFDVVHD